MDLRSLRYFQVVAECGSYSRGSELLRISQPAVSRAVRMLEEELGRPLFERHGHGVTLTEAGRLLLERSQSILRQVEQTARELRNGASGPAGAISIALPPAAGYALAPLLMDRLKREFPNVFLRFVGGFSGYIYEWLIRGQVDIACLHDPLPQRGFEMRRLLREEVFLVGRPGACRDLANPVPIAQLLKLPLALPSGGNATRQLLNNWAAQNGAWLQPEVEVDDHTIIRALIKTGRLFSLLTRGAFADDVARGEVAAFSLDPAIHWTLTLVTCRRTPQSELVQMVGDRLVEVIAELGEKRQRQDKGFEQNASPATRSRSGPVRTG